MQHQKRTENLIGQYRSFPLVTNVSHDLKTPLTSILSYTELLAQEPLDYARLLRQTLADMAQAIDKSGLTLRASIPEDEIPVFQP